MARPETLQLGLLPERQMDWRTLATGYGILAFFVVFIVNLGLLWPDRLYLQQKYHVTEVIPLPNLQPKQFKSEMPAEPHAKLQPPPPITTAKLIVPRDVRAARPEQPEITAPTVALNGSAPAVLQQFPGGTKPPPLIVHTGEFGSSAVPTLHSPREKVETGGFGDPNGLAGAGRPGAHLLAANTGSFDLPRGPGYGNGAGGANGLKGTIASAGFGNGIAQGGRGDGRSNGHQPAAVEGAGFDSQQAEHAMVKPQPLDRSPSTTPVEITYKSDPAYTEEARKLQLEGEVLLEIMFRANGQLQVNRVIRSIGHGLDEAAVRSANQIRFRPATRNGVPVDSTAVVHVLFQLAY